MKKRVSVRLGDELTEEMKKIDKPLGFNSWSDSIRNHIREKIRDHYKNHWNKSPPF
jgi:metal-responsive CopG/Arc/MetJ family transcriptional regulator